MADMIIKDANNKEFTIDTAKICDITGDFGISNAASVNDSARHNANRVAVVHNAKFVDSAGSEVNISQLLADMKNGNTNVIALDIDMEATHSGPNHNYCIYYEDSMEKDCQSFVNPFKKPVLKNHNSYSGEPIGRIQNASFGESELTQDRSTIKLRCRITDQDAIPKLLDGRYGTVSIGGTMNTVTCNICGKTILKDGRFKFCGHWRGETYKDQVCYWGAKDIEYHEVSIVNNPADDFAQITKVTVVTDNDNKNKEGSDSMDGNTTATQDSTTQNNASNNAPQAANDASDIKKTISDMIDNLLGTNNTQNQPQATGNTSGIQDNTPQDNTATQQNGNAGDNSLKEQLDSANVKIKELETQLDTLKQEKDAAVADANDARQEAESMKDMCLTLASSNKSLVIDSIIAKECASNVLAQDKIEDRRTELSSKSMKDLNALSDNIKNNQQQAHVPHINNPSLADRTDDNGKQKKDSQQGSTGSNDTRKHVDDYASEIINKLYNK